MTGLQAVLLGSQMKETHVSLLTPVNGRCDVESVVDAFSGNRFKENRVLLTSAILFWGEVKDDNGKLVVASHVRVLWRDRGNEFLIFAPRREGEQLQNFRFVGEVPYSSISFRPRSYSPVSPLDLDVHLIMDPTSPPAHMPDKFQIADRKGDWLRLVDVPKNIDVWISVASIRDEPFAQAPEFVFAEALAEFVKLHSGGAGDPGQFRDRLVEFRKGVSAGGEAEESALAVADTLEGIQLLLGGSHEDAVELIDRALARSPEDSVLLNLSAISRIPDWRGDKETAVRINTLLEQARALDAGNMIIARNLLAWYELLETANLNSWPNDPDVIRRRAADLAKTLRK